MREALLLCYVSAVKESRQGSLKCSKLISSEVVRKLIDYIQLCLSSLRKPHQGMMQHQREKKKRRFYLALMGLKLIISKVTHLCSDEPGIMEILSKVINRRKDSPAIEYCVVWLEEICFLLLIYMHVFNSTLNLFQTNFISFRCNQIGSLSGQYKGIVLFHANFHLIYCLLLIFKLKEMDPMCWKQVLNRNKNHA